MTSSPLDILLDYARSQRDGALGRLAAALAEARAADAKLALLAGFRDEYSARFDAATRRGMTGGELRTYSVFLDKLDAAIRQQQDIVARSAEQARSDRSAWQGKESRVRGYAALAARRGALAALDERRREQKQNDELALRGVAAFAK
jgi:flagellar FliJ protein